MHLLGAAVVDCNSKTVASKVPSQIAAHHGQTGHTNLRKRHVTSLLGGVRVKTRGCRARRCNRPLRGVPEPASTAPVGFPYGCHGRSGRVPRGAELPRPGADAP